MKVYCEATSCAYLINPPAYQGIKIVREGRCMQRKGAWTAVWAPVSLATIAAVLENEGFKVKLDDCIVNEIDADKLQKKLEIFKPDLVVINTATPSIVTDLKVASLAKKANPNCVTVAFGIHVTALPEESLKMEKNLDAVVRGEPEMTIKEVALKMREGEGLTKVRGITFKKGRRIIRNLDRPPIENLDVLPFPAWQHIKIGRHLMPFKNIPFLLVATGRGCPYQCNFCADKTFYGRKLRLRSPKRIVDELEWIGKKFRVKDFLFWSESFTINRQFAKSVAEEIIRRRLKVHWVCNSRVDTVDYNLLKKFAQAGCWMIGYGIESGEQKILNLMNKRTTLKQAKKAVGDAHRAGLEVTGHCVIGYPGETKKTIQKTIEFAKNLGLDFVQFYCAVPFPGSELYVVAKEKGWLTTEDWPFFEQNFSVVNTPQLKAQEVMALRRQAFRDFYLRPKIIWQTIKRIRSFGDLKQFFWMVKDFITWI